MKRKEEVDEKVEKGYIKVWMMFEVQAADKEVAKSAMLKHISSLKNEDVEVVEEREDEIIEVEAPENLKQKGVEKLYSLIYEVVVLSPRFEDIVYVVMNYAPSALEVLAPEEIKIKMGDLQNALASITDMLHKILSHGLGGMIIKR